MIIIAIVRKITVSNYTLFLILQINIYKKKRFLFYINILKV